MGIFVKAPQMILMGARAKYQWPKAKVRVPQPGAETKPKGGLML